MDVEPELSGAEGAAGIEVQAGVAIWERFDPDWYAATYLRRLDARGPADPEQHYAEVGAASGFSPNPYFHEGFYLARYADARLSVSRGAFASGFAHYCAIGHKSRDPHWLFSESYYRRQRPDVTEAALAQAGLRNAYHHFLEVGQDEDATGSPFFDPVLFRALSGVVRQPFSALLNTVFASEPVLSHYFDPAWYLAMYEPVADLIAEGQYVTALHHFLANPDPAAFNPSPDFDEAFYRRTNPDVAEAIARFTLRSGAQHFLENGRFEERAPSPWFDPAYYATQTGVAEDLRAERAPTGFDHFVRFGRVRGLAPARPAYLGEVSEVQAKVQFARIARLMARQRLDFARPERPDISVVIAAFNNFDLTMQTLRCLSTSQGVSFEVVLIDNASRDETARIEARVSGLKLLRNATNQGFLQAVNDGLAHCIGRHVLLLNNDVTIPPEALRLAMLRLDGDKSIGAVGGRVVRAHGLLQEAGNLVFSNGSCAGYGRDGDPEAPEYNFVREVDYCSGVFLMVPRAVMTELGGLSPVFAPAYYEETDLCARIWAAGLRVVYDPAVVVVHLEFGSSRNPDAPRALMRRNRDLFQARHRDWLGTKCLPDPGLLVHGRSARRRPRVLMIEDTIPYRHLGAGFVRSADIVQSLVELGCEVTVFPMNPLMDRPVDPRQGFAETVELLWDRDISHAAAFFAERETFYDTVWVCRAHNLRRLAGVLGGNWGPMRHADVVLDTEALAANREAALAAMEGRVFDLSAALHRELRETHLARAVCAVNPQEAEQLRQVALPRVHVLGHSLRQMATGRAFAERSDILALGSLHGPFTPNADALRWFIATVWPTVREALPEARLLVAGFVAEGFDAAGLLAGPGVEHVGFVEDLATLYDRARVFVAPTRYAAGIPFKVHEAAACGLPVVATALLARQLGWEDGAILAREPDDPAAFADAVVRLYRDEALWQATRDRALERSAADCSPAAFTATVGRIIGLEAPAG